MNCRMCSCVVLMLATVVVSSGCNPQINTFDPAAGVNRRAAVMAAGTNLSVSTLEFDGVTVGSWVVPPPPGQDDARKTVVPLNQGASPPNVDDVTARTSTGSHTKTLTINLADPVAGAAFDVVVPGVEAYNTYYGLQEAVGVMVAGAGFYPGKATAVNPDAGPKARAMPGGHPALGTKMRGEHLLEVFFPRTLPAGNYNIEITNDAIYDPAAAPMMTPSQFTQD